MDIRSVFFIQLTPLFRRWLGGFNRSVRYRINVMFPCLSTTSSLAKVARKW
jgi:hypothetical protein